MKPKKKINVGWGDINLWARFIAMPIWICTSFSILGDAGKKGYRWKDGEDSN